MNVLFGIGMKVVVTVFCRPPEDTLLSGGLRQKREQELECPAGRIGAMRKVSMVARADCEHTQPIQPYSNRRGLPGDARPYDGQATYVNQQKGKNGRIHDVIMISVLSWGLWRMP